MEYIIWYIIYYNNQGINLNSIFIPLKSINFIKILKIAQKYISDLEEENAEYSDIA